MLLVSLCTTSFVLLTLYRQSASQQKYMYLGDSERVWTDSNDDFTLWSSGLTWSYPSGGLKGLDDLYGGIRWAMHPELCDNLLPMFWDGTYMFVRYVHCTTIRDAIAEAFSTWSHNHPLVQFHDVSEQCTADSLDAKGDCSNAQLTISFGNQNIEATQAAYVEHDVDQIEYQVQTTSGVLVKGLATRRARMVLSNTMCWYMDSTFCIIFHRNPIVLGFDVLQVTEVIMYSIECACVLVAMHVLLNFVARAKGHASYSRWLSRCFCHKPLTANERASLSPHTPRERIRRDLSKLSSCGLLVFLFVIIFIPIFHTCVFLPCKNCHGFSGVLAHEIGHVIGFHHPDERPRLNLIQTEQTAQTAQGTSYVNCSNPWQSLQLQAPPEGYDSIMNSKTKHRKSTCLTQNDMDGLYSLYPICDQDGMMTIPTVSCIESLKTQGILRLIISVSIPFFTVASFVILLLNINKYLQTRRNKKLEAAIRRRAHQAMWLRASNRANWLLQHSLTRQNLLRQTPQPKRRHFHRKQIDRQHGAIGMVQSIFGQTPRSGLTPRQAADLPSTSETEERSPPKTQSQEPTRPSILPKHKSRHRLTSRKLVSRQHQEAGQTGQSRPLHSRAKPPKPQTGRLANRTFDAAHIHPPKMLTRHLSHGRMKPDNVVSSNTRPQSPPPNQFPDMPTSFPIPTIPPNRINSSPKKPTTTASATNTLSSISNLSSIPEDTVPNMETSGSPQPKPQFSLKPPSLKRMLTSKQQHTTRSQSSQYPVDSISQVLAPPSSVSSAETTTRKQLSAVRSRDPSRSDPNQLVVV